MPSMYLETSTLDKEHQSSNSNVSIPIQEQINNGNAKVKQNHTTINKGNNIITELRAILQRESQNS